MPVEFDPSWEYWSPPKEVVEAGVAGAEVFDRFTDRKPRGKANNGFRLASAASLAGYPFRLAREKVVVVREKKVVRCRCGQPTAGGPVCRRCWVIAVRPAKSYCRCGAETFRGNGQCAECWRASVRLADKECEGCGRDFRPKADRDRYCSADCGYAASAGKIAAYHAGRREARKKPCERCHMMFLPHRPPIRFCSRRCSAEHRHHGPVRKSAPPESAHVKDQ